MKIDEAQATIYKKDFCYEDLTKSSLVYEGKMHLMDQEMRDLLSRLRFRFTLDVLHTPGVC